MRIFKHLTFALFIIAILTLPSCKQSTKHIEEVSARAATSIEPTFGGIVVNIPPGALQNSGELTVTQYSDPEAIDATNTIGFIYDIELQNTELLEDINIQIQTPDTQAGEIAHPYVIH